MWAFLVAGGAQLLAISLLFIMKPTNPEQKLVAKEMRKKLGNCATCRHAAETLDRCKKEREEFMYRFDVECSHIEYDSNWCK